MVRAATVGVQGAGHPAALIVLDLERHALGPHLAAAAGLGLRDLGIGGRPPGARGAALHAKADLVAGVAAVARLGVDRQIAGADLSVANAPGAGRHHAVVVAAAVTGNAVGAGHAHLGLGALVVRLEVLEPERPVGERRAVYRAIGRGGPELVRLESRAQAGPVQGGAANPLAHRCGRIGEGTRYV